MESKIRIIKQWLGTGSINIFGIQFSGKDTLGVKLAELLDANFLSSGDLVRAAAKKNSSAEIQQAAIDSEQGILTPTEQFRELIVPHLKDECLMGKPLVLSSVGRWYGEEEVVMQALRESRHDLKAVIVMEISLDEVWRRWELSKDEPRNGGRVDDLDKAKVNKRLTEFREKTIPVIEKYDQLGLSYHVNSEQSREDTLAEVVDHLYQLAKK